MEGTLRCQRNRRLRHGAGTGEKQRPAETCRDRKEPADLAKIRQKNRKNDENFLLAARKGLTKSRAWCMLKKESNPRFFQRQEEVKMIKIAPSILSADFCNLESDIRRIHCADWVHVDVMDGMFVPNITVGVPVVKSVSRRTDMFLDVHLMIEKPVRFIDAFAQAGASLLSVHLEADHPTQILEALKKMDQYGIKKAVALRPITSPEAVLPYIEMVDMVLVMTVEPGFGGQAFMDSQLDTIRRVREIIDQHHPECDLEVDGGINPVTAKKVIAAGANVLVAGSAVYGAPDIDLAIESLRM